MKYALLLLMLFCRIQTNAQTDDEYEVRKVIGNLFSAMQVSDTAKMRQCFHEDARLQTALINPKTLKTKLLNESVDSFIVKTRRMISDTLLIEERILYYNTKVDEPMATVWAPYEFYRNGRLSHTGVDAFQLFRTEQGWKIIQVCDTRKRKTE